MTNAPVFRSIGTPLDVADADLCHLNHRMGVPTLMAPATPPAKPAAPTRPYNLHLPDYALQALKAKAFEANASVRYIILKALNEAGIAIDAADLVQDARRAS
jgi:hypothetical protein